jgi:hypothetical protein
MTTGPLLRATTGHAAGYPSKALAAGTQAAGTLVFITGEDVNPGILAEVSFETDDILSLTFTATQETGTGFGSSLSDLTVTSTATGFIISSTVAPAANTIYSFTYAS